MSIFRILVIVIILLVSYLLICILGEKFLLNTKKILSHRALAMKLIAFLLPLVLGGWLALELLESEQAPSFDPPIGTISADQNTTTIHITASDDNKEIYYSTDMKDPKFGQKYEGPFEISEDTYIRARTKLSLNRWGEINDIQYVFSGKGRIKKGDYTDWKSVGVNTYFTVKASTEFEKYELLKMGTESVPFGDGSFNTKMVYYYHKYVREWIADNTEEVFP